ncbi:hypothetical protein KGF56_000450 [Candida oxycetoniae]|uniref:Large ribosomal subunit protein mL40 n=1 Tax=Candida oxycetoniae TaxID=497107 RepID=A0AAI9T1F2_9ASCO|nr:uncharacterized protein KGF56_000450 [Candida oxycetoniae]KAI3406844.2 hypothetical protein KGF56_000450 [Candida oxycetoniae]
MLSQSKIKITDRSLILQPLKVFARFKRQSARNEQVPLSSATQKIVNQLSVLSASRKQPKLLRLCNEDLIKHRTIMNAWKLFKQKQQQKQTEQLRLQYESIYNAMEDLKMTSPELFKAAGGGKVELEPNSAKNSKKFTTFPLEMRVPTDYPPNKPWIYAYTPPKN